MKFKVRKAGAKLRAKLRWHKWFAWFPVNMKENEKILIWMEFVERKGRMEDMSWDEEMIVYEYREIK
jgi:hypothetical protein